MATTAIYYIGGGGGKRRTRANCEMLSSAKRVEKLLSELLLHLHSVKVLLVAATIWKCCADRSGKLNTSSSKEDDDVNVDERCWLCK